jgi:hypothetical protein
MTSLTFDIKFPLDTYFTFGLLTFDVREDKDLKMLPLGPASGMQSGGVYSGLDSFAGLFIRTAKLVRHISIMTFILRPFVGASSSSSSASSLG